CVLLRISHIQRPKGLIANLAHLRSEWPEQELAHPHVVNQFSAVIDDINKVQRLAVATMFAHIIEYVLHGPLLVHSDEIRRHQAAHAVFRVAEQCRGDATLLRRKQSNQLPRRCAGQFLQQRRPIVRRHLVRIPTTCSCAMARSNFCCASKSRYSKTSAASACGRTRKMMTCSSSGRSTITSATSAGGQSRNT